MNFLNEMSSADIQHTFNNTYIKVLHNNSWKAGFVHSVGPNYLDVTLGTQDAGLTRIPFSAVDLSQSDLGMMWYAGVLYYVARRAERQYRRGLRNDGIVTYCLRADGSSVCSRPSGALFHKIAKFFLEGEIKHNNIFSRDFGRKGQILWFRSLPIGVFNKDLLTVYSEVSLPPAIVDNFEVVYAKDA